MTPAVVAAAAAVLGALLAAYASRSLEALRLRAALIEKAEERKLQAIEAFLLAATAWLDWLVYIEDQGWEGRLEELNSRVKARDDTYRRLLLLASDDLHTWLRETYNPAEYRLKQTYGRKVRYGARLAEEDVEARRRLSRLLREDLIAVARSEVKELREPIHGTRVGLPTR